MAAATLLTKVRAWGKKAAHPKKEGRGRCRGRCPVRDWCAVLALGAVGFAVLVWHAWSLYRTVAMVDAESAAVSSEGSYERAVDQKALKEVLRRFEAREERHRILLEQRVAVEKTMTAEGPAFPEGAEDRYNEAGEPVGAVVDPVLAE